MTRACPRRYHLLTAIVSSSHAADERWSKSSPQRLKRGQGLRPLSVPVESQISSSPRYREDLDESAEVVNWLVRLRWMAIFGVLLASALAAIGIVPGVNLWVTSGAVILGVVTNLSVAERNVIKSPWVDHQYQALLDTGALTLVVWASGGADCPFIAFYAFPILLAALLGDRQALWTTGLACGAGLAFQLMVLHVPILRVGEWNPAPDFEALLSVFAVTLTVAMAAYFAARLNGALRIQMAARKEADALVGIAFEGLDAAIEMFSDSEVLWQNRRAVYLFGRRVNEPWACPEYGHAACWQSDEPKDPEALATEQGPNRHRLVMAGAGQKKRVLEMLVLPVPDTQLHLAVYLDRTHEDAYQKKLMRTEALASLGRTVQGVAHELNTPLATIQTLGRDLLDAMNLAKIDHRIQADLTESAEVILSEVGRCSRITHALLGRPQAMTDIDTGKGSVLSVVERAVAVVAPRKRELIRIDLGGLSDMTVPFDPVVQICVNLIQNALDAAPDQVVEVTASMCRDMLHLAVRDHGPGLDETAMLHLYEPFFTTKPPGQGTGLGLYMSYTLADSLGQKLTVSNRAEGGVLALLKIPVERDEQFQ